MRILLSIALASYLPAFAQTDTNAKLESLLAEAQRAQARSDYRAAGEAYRQALSIRPGVAELWSNLGLIEYESHEYLRAESAFRRALTIDKSLFAPNLFLGLNLLALKRPGDAVPYLTTAEKLNPQDAQAPLALGRAYHALFDAARSEEWYQRAADVAPRNGDAWYGLGIAYFDLAQSASAKLSRAFAQSPYLADLKAQTRAEEAGARDHDEAVADAAPMPPQRSLPGSGSMTETDLERFAAGAYSSRDFRASAAAAERLRQKYPSDVAGWYWAVRAYQQLGMIALARAGEMEPDSPAMHALLGDAYQRRKMFREAQDEYSKMLTLEPGSAGGLAGLAAAYLGDGRLDDAQATARKALARDPEDSEMNLLMGEILVAQHSYGDAEPYLQRGLHARPELLPRVHALLGRVYARTGRPKDAIAELAQGLASDEDGSVYYQLARLYQSLGDSKAAADAFEKSRQSRVKHDVPAETVARVD